MHATIIRPETSSDSAAIRHVNHCAFGQDDEANLVDELRRCGLVRVSLVAERARQIVGHILFSDVEIASRRETMVAISLAPMAVLPEYQKQGIGSQLVRQGLQQCRDLGYRIAVVVGHPLYYPRFGFTSELTASLQSKYAGEAFMAMELVPGALRDVTGEVRYPQPFDGV